MIWLGISIIISSIVLDAGMYLAVERYFELKNNKKIK